MVGIALIGVVTIIALGATALTDIQDSSRAGAAEQAMTQFDSRTAQVALGDSRDQTISIGQTDGSYRVDPDAGHVRIVHYNFDGNASDGDDSAPPGDGDFEVGASADGDEDNDVQLYESTLGAIYYERDGTTLGYQAGGVWRRTASGSTMASPPEFHYRGSTLTFPIVRVNNDTTLPSGVSGVQSGSGSLDLRVSQHTDSREVYPTRQSGYPNTTTTDAGFDDPGNENPFGVDGDTDDGNGDGGYYDNPATNGTVVVYIQSEFYGAWAEYFRTRTDGNVSTSDDDEGYVTTADDPDGDGPKGITAVALESTGFTGPFGMPGDGSSLFLQGIDGHSMSSFEIDIVPDTQDEASFSNLKWSMYVQDGNEQFEMHVRPGSGSDKDCGDENTDLKADLTIYYTDDGGTMYQGWHADDAFAARCEDLDGDGTADEMILTADFVDDENDNGDVDEIESNDPAMEYVSKSGMNDLVHFGVTGDVTDPYNPAADQTDHGFGWESNDYDPDSGDTQSVDRVVNHYFSVLGPGFDLTVDDKGGDTVSEAGSSGVIEYTGGSSFVTYMHITENDVVVRID
jgi:type II secretory pathway pseudopilin PulG